MHDAVRLLLALLALTTATFSAIRVHRLQHASGGRSGTTWPYAEPVCILLTAAAALAITYLI